MLCRYLGFTKTSENKKMTVPFGPNGHGIASGDLICYKVYEKETDCCINLVPSTPTSTVEIPYVQCK